MVAEDDDALECVDVIFKLAFMNISYRFFEEKATFNEYAAMTAY